MKFIEFLRRYHIAPLKYDDDRLLVEKDYEDLFVMLTRYEKARELCGCDIKQPLDESLIKSAEFSIKNSIISPNICDIMDILMGFDSNPVVETNMNK